MARHAWGAPAADVSQPRVVVPVREPGNRTGGRIGDWPVSLDGVTKPPVLGRRTLRVLCLVCLGAIVYGTLGPVDASRGAWIAKPGSWNWMPAWRHSDVNDVATNFAVYVPAGIALRLLVRRRGRTSVADFALAMVLAVGLSYLTELLQQVMPARSSSLTDVLVDTLGACAGCLYAVRVQQAARHVHALMFAQARSGWLLWTITAGLAVVTVACRWIGRRSFHSPAGSAAHWIPFYAQFHASFVAAITSVVGRLAGSALLTLVALILTRGRGAGIALLVLLGLLVAGQLSWVLLTHHAPDLTPFVLVFGAWLVTTRMWRSICLPAGDADSASA
jgi:hypothetical protein